MPKITINGKIIEFENGMTVLQACELAEVEIPRFCYCLLYTSDAADES